MSKEALVLRRTDLEKSGFLPREIETDGQEIYYPLRSFEELRHLLELCAEKGFYKERFGEGGAGDDPSLQQMIFYGYVLREDGRFLLYQRGGTEGDKYQEAKLAGKVSLGIGGHMERSDLSLAGSFYRELDEEIQILENGKVVDFRNSKGELDVRRMKEYLRIVPVGLVKDEKKGKGVEAQKRYEVGKVHFGIVCQITPLRNNLEIMVKSESGENVASWYCSPEEYIDARDSYLEEKIEPEGWTDIVFEERILPTHI